MWRNFSSQMLNSFQAVDEYFTMTRATSAIDSLGHVLVGDCSQHGVESVAMLEKLCVVEVFEQDSKMAEELMIIGVKGVFLYVV